MEIKILQVFYDKNGLPYKDKERTVHYPITSGTFLGASNTTQIRFYYDQLDELNESTFVAVSKLPNGKICSEILENEYDSELQESYAVLNLSQFYTQYKGDVYISLQGYQGGVRVEQDEDGIYQIYGTPTIQSTGSIRMYVAYAPTFVGSGETENVNFQRVLAELSTKLGIRQETLHVEELPSVGNPNVWYVVNDDPNDATKANIYIWNATTQTYVWVGDNTLNLGDYYTQEEGEQFENNIDNRVTSVENELSSVASGSPKGVYSTVSDLETAYPTGTTGIYVVSASGHWYYWNGTAWTDGGVYQATAIPNYSIEWFKTNFVERGKNLFDKNTALDGYYISYGSGSAFENASFVASDFIPIDASKGYVIVRPYNYFQMAFYDESKTYISGTYYGNTTNGISQIPNNAKYLRFSNQLVQKNITQLEYGQTATEYEDFYFKFTNEKPFVLPNDFVKWFNTDFAVRGKNIYDKSKAIDGYYIPYTTGNPDTNNSYFASNFIEIDSSQGYLTLNIHSSFQMAFYDSTKTYISGAYYASNPNGVIAIPSNAKYVRFSERIDAKNQIQLEYGQTKTSYQEYQYDFSKQKPISQETSEINNENSVLTKTNLIDYTDNTIDKYYGSVAAIYTGHACWIINSFIRLKPNTKYSIYPKNAFYETFTWLTKTPKYKADQSNIENFGYSDSTGSFTTDSEHIFLYITLKVAPTEKMKLIEGDIPNNDFVFGDKILFGNFERKTFYVGANRQFTKLKDGVEYASQFPNALLIVDDGTYDLVSEYGQDYLDNTNDDIGMMLKNGLHIKFSSKSKVVFNYNGDNAFIHHDFSPFNTGIYGGTLENMTLECSNCRYAIHDERGNSSDRYENRYINCVMSLDNSQNPDWVNSKNIGGGLGQDGYIEIVGCVFNNAVTYHNNHTGSTQSKSKVIIKDCYLEHNGIVIQGYNSNITEKSVFIVTNTHTDYIDVQTTVDNVICYQWNNDIY